MCFVKKISVFSLLLIIASVLVNYLYIDQVMANSFDFQMEKQFEKAKDNVRILIAGDSHPRNSVYPRYLPESFVVATSGENVLQTYFRLRYYLEEEKLNIEYVILPLDLHTLSSFRVNRFNNAEYWKKYIDYYELGIRKENVLKYIFLRFSGEFAYINGLDNFLVILENYLGNKQPPLVIDGYLAFNGYIYKDVDYQNILDERVKRHFIYNNHVNLDVVNEYLETLALLKGHDVNVVLVRYPIMEEYYQAASTQMSVDVFYFDIEQILRNHGFSYPILDYHDVFFTHPEFFADVDHLNVNGAVQFTKILKKDLELLGLFP